MPALILEAIAHTAGTSPAVAAPLRQRALRRALDYIAMVPDEPIGIDDLCRATGASVRTLRRAFRENLGVSPKAYLQARRLNAVQRELRSYGGGFGQVNEVANRWGFWHMGQFAADYRRLFGELPSRTLARTHGVRTAADSA